MSVGRVWGFTVTLGDCKVSSEVTKPKITLTLLWMVLQDLEVSLIVSVAFL